MKAVPCIGTALMLCMAALSHAAEPEWGLKFSALGATALTARGSDSSRMALEPSVKWLRPSIEWRARVRTRWSYQQGDQRDDTDVRELTATWRGQEANITLGAQQLNWGRMDILRLSDVINPVDQHDLFFEELPEAKLALWMINAEWQRGTSSWQLVLSPEVPVDRMPATWNGFPVDVQQPKTSMRNSTVALRYAFEVSGWSADLMAVHGWRTTPFLRVAPGSMPPRLVGEPLRQNSVGFSADKPWGATVLRLEGLYARSTDRSPDTADGERKKNHPSGLGAGLDVQWKSWFFAGQAIAERGHGEQGQRHFYLSAIAQKKWLQDRLAMRALHVREMQSDAGWSSLRLSYEFTKNQLMQLQADHFFGKTQHSFGTLKEQSRFAVSWRVSF
ncbi:MAG: hypothetical protein HEQ39_17095 [Rhizobacter sp.]